MFSVWVRRRGASDNIHIIWKRQRVCLNSHRLNRVLPWVLTKQPHTFSVTPYYWARQVFRLTESHFHIKVWHWTGIYKVLSVRTSPSSSLTKLNKPHIIQDGMRRRLLLCQRYTWRWLLREDQTRHQQQIDLKISQWNSHQPLQTEIRCREAKDKCWRNRRPQISEPPQ